MTRFQKLTHTFEVAHIAVVLLFFAWIPACFMAMTSHNFSAVEFAEPAIGPIEVQDSMDRAAVRDGGKDTEKELCDTPLTRRAARFTVMVAFLGGIGAGSIGFDRVESLPLI